MSICNFDQCCISVFVYLRICICVFASQTPRNIVSEVLLPLPFQKYSTCHVYLHLWPMLYLCICVFVYLYLCICKSDTGEHCFWGPCIITFQKMYGLYGLKHHTVEIRGGVTRRDDERTTNERQTMEDRATQPLGCWKAEFRNYIFAPNLIYS